ncbi:set1/Ash2 histone methyltransferase complex subunit ASH2-like [Halichondria panicea]|uniref:set1/Ash2 histone methyltransferase complex subunit ASH2-like n=1 Tax=Halichondria panicea TaxID=6063 RepID=UPI00312B5F3C
MEDGFQIQCFTCGNWFTSTDLRVCLDGYIPYMTNYEYTCQSCGPEEGLTKKPASFIQVGITVLANLTLQHMLSEPPRRFFSLDDEIIPFVWDNWDNICTKRSRAGNWKNNLASKLANETRIFCEKKEGSNEYGLVDQDLTNISPRRYESKTVPTKGVGSKIKRKATDNSQAPAATKKSKGDGGVSSRAMSHGYPLEHPYNKDGYRYILAEKDPHATLELQPEDMAGRPIPPELYRSWLSTKVLLALHDRAPQLKIAENRLTVTGDKGYCMVRATHGVSAGTWFYEVHIDDLDSVPDSAVRLGWSQGLGNLQAPCGYDKLSYSWRSKYGTRFHQSKGKHYSDAFTTGDTLGFLIHLPRKGYTGQQLPSDHKDKALIKFKNFFYFEEKDDLVEEFEKGLKTLPGSYITFYKNGEPQGTAWSDLFAGVYYPALSLYKGVTVTANFGPDFKCPPKDVKYNSLSESAEITVIDQIIAEMLFHVENILDRDSPPFNN